MALKKFSAYTLGELTNIRTGKLDANAAGPTGQYPFFTCAREPLRIDKYAYDCECVLVAGNGDLNIKHYSGKFEAYQRTYIVEVLDTNRLLSRYLYYFLDSYLVRLRKLSIGGVIKYIKLENLTTAPIPLPPLPEQKRIAAILDKADAIRRKRQEAIKLSEQFLRSVFLDMFGDPVTNPKGWKVVPLKQICSKIGSGATPRGGRNSYVSSGISLIRSMNVYDDRFLHKDLAFLTDSQAQELANVTVLEKDILFNITGASVCRVAIVPSDILPARVNQHVAILRCKCEYIYPSFLLHCLLSPRMKQKLLQTSRNGGATREALTKEGLEHFVIPTPSLDKQKVFDDIYWKFQILSNKFDNPNYNSLFTSLSHNAFKGEL